MLFFFGKEMMEMSQRWVPPEAMLHYGKGSKADFGGRWLLNPGANENMKDFRGSFYLY